MDPAFLGKWKYKFDPAATKRGQFFTPQNGKKEVEFMNVKARFNLMFDQGLAIKAVELPYDDDKFSLIAFLPEDGAVPLEKLEDRF